MSRRSPGSRACCFSACAGSLTTQGRRPARVSRSPPCCLPPKGDGVGALKGIFEAQSPRPPMPLSTLQASPCDDTCKTQGRNGVAFSFPAGLFHPLQHAGLSRRFPRVAAAFARLCSPWIWANILVGRHRVSLHRRPWQRAPRFLPVPRLTNSATSPPRHEDRRSSLRSRSTQELADFGKKRFTVERLVKISLRWTQLLARLNEPLEVVGYASDDDNRNV